MAFAFGDWGSALTERALSSAFICLQSESRVSLSDTRWGFLPILFNLRRKHISPFQCGGNKPQDSFCIIFTMPIYSSPFSWWTFCLPSRIYKPQKDEIIHMNCLPSAKVLSDSDFYVYFNYWPEGWTFWDGIEGYGCKRERESTKNGIPGLRSRLPLPRAIYSQSKFHWSSLANIHLKSSTVDNCNL